MHVKFVKPKGNAKAAVDYVCRKPKEGEQVEVLRGNPETTSDLGMSLDFKHTYTSAVIAWHPQDKPSNEQINEVLNDFESLAFAGLEPNQYNMLAVQHTEPNGSTHVHIIVPRVELETGRSLNIAPPGSFKAFDSLRDYHNLKNDWKSPDISANPQNARTTNLGLNRGSRKELMKSIDAYVTKLINSDDIRDRTSLLTELEAAGLTIKRAGANYITVIDENDETMKKGLRLQGDYYAKDFKRDKWLEAASEREDPKAQANPQQSLRKLEDRLRKASEKRAEYNKDRYCQSQPKADEINAAFGLQSSLDDLSLPDGLPNDLRHGLAAVPQQNDHTTGLQADNSSQPSPSFGMRSKSMGHAKNSKRQRHNLTPQQLDNQLEAILRMIEAIARLLGFNPSLSANFNAQGANNNDGNRDQISETIAASKRANELTQSSLERASASVIRTSASVERNAERTSERADEIQQVFRETAHEFERANRRVDDLEQQRQQEQQQNNSGDFNYVFK